MADGADPDRKIVNATGAHKKPPAMCIGGSGSHGENGEGEDQYEEGTGEGESPAGRELQGRIEVRSARCSLVEEIASSNLVVASRR